MERCIHTDASPGLKRRKQKTSATRLFRHAVREACCYLLTQLPLFRRMSKTRGQAKGVPIIYVHGYGQSCGSFWALTRALSALGHGPMFAYNYSTLNDIDRSAEGLGRFIDRVRDATGAPRVDVIGHSMGGVVIAAHLRSAGSEHRVRRCITLASAHGGIRWPGPLPGRGASQLRRDSAYLRNLAIARLPIPVLNVSSENDDFVFPATALSARGTEVSIGDVGHIALLFSEEMFQTAAAFLGEDEAVRLPFVPANQTYALAEINPPVGPELAATG
jgi:triacylglycerol lipase